MKRFLVVGVLCAACGGASSGTQPHAPGSPAVDQVAGCWRDRSDRSLLCFERRGYVLFLPDGTWDRVVVDWAKLTPSARSGRTRTPRPLWLSVQVERGELVLDDGASKSRLERPSKQEQAALATRIARLPQISELCDRALACRRAASSSLGVEVGSASELTTARACLGYLNAIARVLRHAEHPVPPECAP